MGRSKRVSEADSPGVVREGEKRRRRCCSDRQFLYPSLGKHAKKRTVTRTDLAGHRSFAAIQSSCIEWLGCALRGVNVQLRSNIEDRFGGICACDQL